MLLVVVALVAYLAWNVRRFDSEWDEFAQLAAARTDPPWATSPKEAIVVLTGARGRIPRAVQLMQSRDSGLLFISGAGKTTTKKELFNQQGGAAGAASEIWARVEVESLSTSTIENAQETRKFLRPRKFEKVILVTSDYHMPRALAIFRRVYTGIQYWPYPVSSSAEESGRANRMVESYAKPTIEFFKWFLFRHLFIHFL